MTVDTTAALARVAAAEGDEAEAAARCDAVLARWRESEDRHYALAGLRWAAAFHAQRGDRTGAHACAEALAGIAASTGHTDALAALAASIGETALMEGDTDTAAEQLSRAVELQRELDTPFEKAQVELRAGIALAAAGERELALERLGDAHRCARKLGARPLAAAAAKAVADARRIRDRAARGARRGRRGRRALAARARGHAARGRRAHEPRDRARPVPQPAHRGHARAQHPAQARLPVARRSRRARQRARAVGEG